MRQIQLTKGYSCLVDDDAPPEVFKFRWKALVCKSAKVYAVRNLYAGVNPVTGKPVWKACLMHRLITGAAPGLYVDHANGNSLDNTRKNLRVCTQRQNLANRRVVSGTSTFKGVYFNREKRLWQAQISLGKGRVKYLGRFSNEADAGKAYDDMARMLHGAFSI